ncbi:BnaCnng54960D [Brassica napus]|uniref:(rape) hypothetical protein n=1 Tax=Brassica napus TaxID=3708 RepID=A0A078JLX9_BRANA|nr:unnamed protein product [Brassica napus]CDY67435.1 BnaCnng54960D [Brassica napus]
MTYNGVNGVVKLLFPELKASDVFIGMVKTKAERYTKYEGYYKMEKILEFLGKNKFPLITKSSESNTAWVYSTTVKLQVMIFAKADDFQSMAPPLEDIARRFKSKLMFIYIDITNENLVMSFLTLFGIEDADKTVVAAFDNKLNSKYLLEADPSPSNIEDAVLKEKCKIDLCVVRITGSSNMFEGINLSRCSELMKEEGESADADIASCYYHRLLRGIHVVTTTQDRSGKVLDICFNHFSIGN